MMTQTVGKCLCGSVAFSLEKPPLQVNLCHCGMCRRWGGGLPLAAIHARVTLHADNSLRWWKSSEWAERGFCAECGSSLFWRAPGMEEWGVSAGALDDIADLTIGGHIYIDDKPVFYEFADDTPRQSGAEFTAQFLSNLAAQHGEGFLKNALEKNRAQYGDQFADEVERFLSGHDD